jgi:hypothetical protein
MGPSQSQVPLALSYQKDGTRPPIYVAGSFSDPPWRPLEMDVSTNEHGEHVFTKEAMVEPGSNIQYKFRIGPGEWWGVDERQDIGI